MKKILFALLAAMLIAGLVLGCAAPTPAPHPEVKLELLSYRPGQTGYVLGFGAAELITKNHPWLRVSAVEGAGGTPNLRTIAQDPGKRKDTLVQTYTGARVIWAVYAGAGQVIWTKDRSISKPSDLAGKSIMLPERGQAPTLHYESLFKRWGVWDTLKVSHGPVPAHINALKDGLVDAIAPLLGFITLPDLVGPPYNLSGGIIGILAARPQTGWISIPPDDVPLIAQDAGLSASSLTIPAGTLKKWRIDQPEDMYGFGYIHGMLAARELDDELAYEIIKTVYENADRMSEVVGPPGELIAKEGLGAMPVPEELFHPGALKFLKEKGLKIGH